LATELRGGTKDLAAALRSEMKDMELRLVNWFAGLLLVQSGAIVALIKLL
jgi:hypothetical protein